LSGVADRLAPSLSFSCHAQFVVVPLISCCDVRRESKSYPYATTRWPASNTRTTRPIAS
jgi:hypothetical protein